MDLILNVPFDEAVGYLQKQGGINALELAVPEQLTDSIDCFVELQCFDTEQDIVRPYLPGLLVTFQSLLAA